MYRSRQTSPRTIIFLVVLGVLGGVGFFLYDNLRPETEFTDVTTPSVALSPPTETPVTVPTALAAAPTQASPPRVFNQPGPSEETTIFIPSAGVFAPVIETFLSGDSWDISQLGVNAGHLQGTSWVDQVGNVVVSGHVEMSDGRKGVFADLPDVTVGETIVITDDGQEHMYTVIETKYVEPSDLTVLYPTNTNQLTLITCSDYNFFSNIYERRFVVVAEKVV